jgi:hypothetical protein
MEFLKGGHSGRPTAQERDTTQRNFQNRHCCRALASHTDKARPEAGKYHADPGQREADGLGLGKPPGLRNTATGVGAPPSFTAAATLSGPNR